jgi:hypothetical protein
MHGGGRLTVLVGVLAAAVGLVGPAAQSANRPVEVTVLGDSVADSLQYAPSAEQLLARGYDVRFDLRVCRRLASRGCPYDGAIPPSALDSVRADGSSLGDVLIVDVGYNDDPSTYRSGMAGVIRAAKAAGVERVVWVTLREMSRYASVYRQTNDVIESEAGRFTGVEVADWNGWTAGKPWFRPDGLHLTVAGAAGLAEFLRPYLEQAAGEVRAGSTS